MSKERYINTKFWDDNYIIQLDPTEKLIFIYVLTNPLTNIIGIYEIALKRIAFDTGIDKDMVIKILERFEKDDKMKYANGYIAIKNFTKYQKDNPSINQGIEKLIPEIPIELLQWADIDRKRFPILDTMLPEQQAVAGCIQAVPYFKLKLNNKLNRKENMEILSPLTKDLLNTKSQKFVDTLNEFINMRAKNKKKMTDYGVKLLLKKLDKLTSDENEQIAIIEQSIENCWQGVFALKDQPNGKDKKYGIV